MPNRSYFSDIWKSLQARSRRLSCIFEIRSCTRFCSSQDSEAPEKRYRGLRTHRIIAYASQSPLSKPCFSRYRQFLKRTLAEDHANSWMNDVHCSRMQTSRVMAAAKVIWASQIYTVRRLTHKMKTPILFLCSNAMPTTASDAQTAVTAREVRRSVVRYAIDDKAGNAVVSGVLHMAFDGEDITECDSPSQQPPAHKTSAT